MDKLLCTGTEPNKWAMHSIADAVHDGGRAILDEEPAGIGFAKLFVDPLEAGIYDEEVIKTKLIGSLPPHKKREETFLVRTDTALSPVKGTFQLAKTCNTFDKTLVYQDAGPTVYDLICNGANALNPGSVCDPASRSLDNAVFTKSQETLRISGCVFGFNDKVPEIILKNFTGKTVVCGVQYNKKWYDMAAGKEVGGENEVKTVKHINKPAGFLSGNGVNGVLGVNTPNVKLFYIGKLLGDALQVITMLETINNAPNPYYQIKAEGETQLINTHDRLQYTRAVVLGVGALLTFKKGDTKQAAYAPGAGTPLDDAGLKQYYITRIKEARTTIKNRFDEALRSMGDSLLGPGDSFRNNYSKVDGYIHMVSSEEKERAKNFMERCAIETMKVRKIILDQFKEVDNLEGKNPDQLKTYYQFIHSRIASQSPGGPIISGSGYNTKGNITSRFKVAITETNDYIIDFRYAFKQMEDGAKPGDPYGGTNKWLKERVKRAREQDEATSVEEPSAKRANTAGKRKGRKGTFRKKGGKSRVEEPATEGVKAVEAFTSRIYAYETRRIGFDEKGELVMVADDINRFWKQEETKSTKYKTNIQVPADEAKEIEDGFDYVPPEGVTVTWKNILEAALKEDEDSLLAEFIRFLTGKEELTSDAFLTAKVLIENAVESGCKKRATKVQDPVILESLEKQLDMYLYSLTGVPETPNEDLAAAENLLSMASGPSKDTVEGAKGLLELAEPPDEELVKASANLEMLASDGARTPPLPASGTATNSVTGTPQRPNPLLSAPQSAAPPQSAVSTLSPGSPPASQPPDSARRGTSDSEGSLAARPTGDSFVPPPPPAAPGAPTGGKRRTRRMKRLFR
jgi:hypothetical protein